MIAIQTQTDDCLMIHDGGDFSLIVSLAFGMAIKVRVRWGNGVWEWINVIPIDTHVYEAMSQG